MVGSGMCYLLKAGCAKVLRKKSTRTTPTQYGDRDPN